ncbi:MAG: leucine-rich repeat domain-containing protein [Adhaeribacter sp.]
MSDYTKEEVYQQIQRNLKYGYTKFALHREVKGGIPIELWQLRHLQHLSLDYCNLKFIPPEIKNLVNLEYLYLNNNELRSFPLEICELSNLKTLSLENNQIKYVPKAIGNLSQLTSIKLNKNQIKFLPKEIGELKLLLNVELNENEFKQFPEPLCYLLNLISLEINQNKITSIPSTITNLSNLFNLDLSGNNLNSLPKEFASTLRKVKEVNLGGNPFINLPDIQNKSNVEIFTYLENLTNDRTYVTYWQIPEPLRVAFQQYLNYFKTFIYKRTGEKIRFDVVESDNGLKLIAETNGKISINKLNDFLEDYIRQNSEFDAKPDLDIHQQFAVRQMVREWEMERSHLNYKIQTLLEENVLLKQSNIKLESRITFFERHSERILNLVPGNNAYGIDNVKYELSPVPPKSIEAPFDADKLLDDIIESLKTQCGRKLSHKDEDLHNDNLTDLLRARGYNITDQTRHGGSSKNAGELDLMVRNNVGGSLSIIEAFKAASAGSKDANISSHINKLLHKYDTAGHEVNFIVVYSEAANFQNFWNNYCDYMEDLNNKHEFDNKYELKRFKDTGRSRLTNIRVGQAKHDREGKEVLVYHIVADMYCPPAKDAKRIQSKNS